MRMKTSLLLSCVLIVASNAVSAQAPPGPVTPPAQTAPPPLVRPTNCAPVPSQGTVAPGATTGRRGEPLGDKLARADGVLCPPTGIDPEIRAPTPDVGTMRVIPPPGSPGGDPNIRPK